MSVLGLQVTLRAGEMPSNVPTHVDTLAGAQEAAPRVDGGRLDATLARYAKRFRATSVYPARRAFGHIGSQHLGYDDLEHAHGLSRTLRVRLENGARVQDAVRALRDLAIVERVRPETLAMTPRPPAGTEAVDECTPVPGHAIVRSGHRMTGERGDERVRVGVVDSGVALGHPELQGLLLAGYDTVDLGFGHIGDLELIGNSRGRDFNPRDEVGHGSHVAGVIGAQGFRTRRGVADGALVLPIRVLAAAIAKGGRRPIGVGGLSDIDCGLKVACDLGAKVINMSFGTSEKNVDPEAPPPHDEVLRYAAERGVILVAAMGNTSEDERLWPAAHPDVIAVGAVDGDLRPCSFSTRGAHIALAAPGERIWSLDLHGYRCSTGTSHAAPFVAGAAALLVAIGRRRGLELNGSDVRRLVVETTQARPDDRWNRAMGHGVLDVAAAVKALAAYTSPRSLSARDRQVHA
jgi:subtilisin family serine protease